MSDRPLVYLLDDEPAVLRAPTRLLDAQGFRVQAYESASALFAGIDPDRPACLVLELAMPELDGLAVQQRLLREAGWLGMVFLTGHGDFPHSVRAIKAGAEDFLGKPINLDPAVELPERP